MARGSVFLLALLCVGAVAAQAQELDKAEISKVLATFLGDAFKEQHLIAKRRLLTNYHPGQYAGSFQSFLQNILGGNWTDYVPSAWANSNFDWSKLGTFDYTSNMQYFVDAIYMKNITAPKTLKDVHDNMEVISSIFCTPETYVPSQKVFATCVGPKVTLAYVPKICVLEEATQQVVCDPAKIVLSMNPGGCTHKYHSPSLWKAKQCKITGSAGFSKATKYGGNAYDIPLTSLSVGYSP